MGWCVIIPRQSNTEKTKRKEFMYKTLKCLFYTITMLLSAGSIIADDNVKCHMQCVKECIIKSTPVCPNEKSIHTTCAGASNSACNNFGAGTVPIFEENSRKIEIPCDSLVNDLVTCACKKTKSAEDGRIQYTPCSTGGISCKIVARKVCES